MCHKKVAASVIDRAIEKGVRMINDITPFDRLPVFSPADALYLP